ncbi:MAG: hypothetical protein IPF47_20115 [Gemmatimonadetes bacterium]|nr:hypothetical protein [Gemmatimonadota bacterium]
MATMRTPPATVRYSNFPSIPDSKARRDRYSSFPSGVNAEMAMSESVEYAAP